MRLPATLGMVLALFATLVQSAPLNAELQTWLKQHPEATWAPEADYGPFIYLDKQNKPVGLSADFLELAARKTGLQLRALPAAPLSDNLQKVKRGEVDLLTSLRPTPERAQFVSFSSAYVSIPAVLALHPSRTETGLQQLSGAKLGVGKGYAVESFVRENYPQVKWLAVPSDGAALDLLARGEIDGLVADAASLHFLRQEKNLKLDLRIAGSIGFDYPLSMAWRKDIPQLGEIIQAGLQEITPVERDAILQRWMPSQQNTPAQQQNWLYIATGGLFALALMSAFWLRRKAG
ncbi:transporter substrate-binding domain-containing protein [Massilia sp. W12]|uniref:transporter substrate-binding domain-containing protein n=1 Tax=Massilia sp. W12 TaxID=3126507 RepID=UPI0030CF4578